MQNLLKRYQSLLTTIDTWFAVTRSRLPGAIVCADGCCGCCRGLFDISLLDARLLRAGYDQLPPEIRATIRVKAETRLNELQQRWPDFSAPYILNLMDDALWTEMPEDDDTPCPLLDADGRCLVYDFRPMTCRLHGLPQIDLDGEVFLDQWCSLNFKEIDPLLQPEVRQDLQQLFQQEFTLLRAFAEELCDLESCELDTFIPLALLIDFDHFPWKEWAARLSPLAKP